MAKYPIIVTRCKGSLQLSLQLNWVGVEAVGPVIVELLLFDVQDTGLPSLAPLGLLGLWLVLKGLHEVLAVEVVLRLPCVIPIIISHPLQQVLYSTLPFLPTRLSMSLRCTLSPPLPRLEGLGSNSIGFLTA